MVNGTSLKLHRVFVFQKWNSSFLEMYLGILAMCYLVYRTNMQWLCKLTYFFHVWNYERHFSLPNKVFSGAVTLKKKSPLHKNFTKFPPLAKSFNNSRVPQEIKHPVLQYTWKHFMASFYIQIRPLHYMICNCHHLALLQIRSLWFLGLQGTSSSSITK